MQSIVGVRPIMANNVDDVFKFIDVHILSELSIVNNSLRLEMHAIFNGDILKNRLVNTHVEIYNSIVSENSRASSSSSTELYFDKCCKHGMIMMGTLQDAVKHLANVTSRDITVLLNYYACTTLQAINANANASRSDDINVGEESEPAEERDRNLICIGGGTLGEIIRVSKRKLKLITLSKDQKHQAASQLAVAKAVCMNVDEKQSFSPDMKIRDKGGMYFPKQIFHDFIRGVNSATVKYTSDASMKHYGTELLQVANVTIVASY